MRMSRVALLTLGVLALVVACLFAFRAPQAAPVPDTIGGPCS